MIVSVYKKIKRLVLSRTLTKCIEVKQNNGEAIMVSRLDGKSGEEDVETHDCVELNVGGFVGHEELISSCIENKIAIIFDRYERRFDKRMIEVTKKMEIVLGEINSKDDSQAQ